MNFNYFKYRNNISISYLKDVYEAIKKIKPSYYKWNSRMNYLDDSLKTQMLERVFAYELYHQLRMISLENDRYSNLRIDAELQKVLSYSSEDEIDILKYPDIVIHESQESINAQKVIIEIKVNRHGVIDIHKLLEYVKVLDFEFGIYICANIGFDEMLKEIENGFNSEIDKNDLKKVIIITCDPQLGIHIISLYQIFKFKRTNFTRYRKLY